jgi:hypothetical protein
LLKYSTNSFNGTGTKNSNFNKQSYSNSSFDPDDPEDSDEIKESKEEKIDPSRLITVQPSFQFIQSFPVGNLPTTPVKVYHNALIDRVQITSNYSGVTGIYLWHNLVNGKQYIGSGYKLSARLAHYYFPSRLLSNRHVSRSILKYGHANFSLIIL